ncbi:MAG: hypothetical protein D6685_10815 [Bacteroidetes bacterium]|nr:hypothetical protein AWN76_002180 [Rhodothermaceae bacterium RA]RMH59837.1 MAG: hypothetical protein D6685_10815 [Bacteroidota bacterium]
MSLVHEPDVWMCHLTLLPDRQLRAVYLEQEHTRATVRALLDHASGPKRRHMQHRLDEIEHRVERIAAEMQRRGMPMAA